ncbi:hypothetical protein BC834DRAFT_877599 [Gloeopeniophorella convolvens]|nr:hypothetical protein BC834DRAFT_877599 [Gloeopeniophorella convolvens]
MEPSTTRNAPPRSQPPNVPELLRQIAGLRGSHSGQIDIDLISRTIQMLNGIISLLEDIQSQRRELKGELAKLDKKITRSTRRRREGQNLRLRNRNYGGSNDQNGVGTLDVGFGGFMKERNYTRKKAVLRAIFATMQEEYEGTIAEEMASLRRHIDAVRSSTEHISFILERP